VYDLYKPYEIVMGAYQKMYFKNLDTPRFLSFLSVFLGHVFFSNNADFRNSTFNYFLNQHLILGIDFYTILSGFLISWIILEEYRFTENFSLSNFWLKRSLRIWPLYFLLIIIGFLLVWMARNILGKTVNDMPPLSWLLTFTLNFYVIKYGQGFLFFILFLWSISVEEQFYTILGVVLKWGKKIFVPFCILLMGISLVFQFLSMHHSINLYYNSLSWIGSFAAGGLLAYFCLNKGRVFERMKNIPIWMITFVYALFILNFAFYDRIYASPIMTSLERLSAILFFGFVIFEQTFCEKHLFQLGKIPFLNYLGKIPYGLFCYHGLVIILYEQATHNISWINSAFAVFLINPIAIFVITVVISMVSYKYFEKPIMSLRLKYQPT